MLHWQVILLSALALLLLISGLVALVLPEPYEGPALYQFDDQHVVRALDLAGAMLLVLGCLAACGAGFSWHRKVYV